MSQTDYVALVAAAVGAFLGSLSAFLLQALWQSTQEKSQRHGALLNAEFALSMQLNLLVNIRNQYLEECREHPERFMRLVLFYGSTDAPQVDFGSLGFIAVKDDASVLHKVQMAQSSYLTALSALETRNSLMADSYESATQTGPIDFETGEAPVTLDGRKARILKGITDSLYTAVDHAIELQHAGIAELAAVSKRLYPKLSTLVVEEIPQGDTGV